FVWKQNYILVDEYFFFCCTWIVNSAFKQGMAGFGELVSSVRWWTLIPGLLGSFFVFASISGYQNVGAATTIAVLVASQLIGGLMLDIFRSHGVPLRALFGPICGAILLVVGAWLVARRSF
ncbi:DMT family transporter, partial [Escherichia coli]|uniref:DMT family transporter n=1 Tax=Escherichia coli TaxID=562 RepID=UPI00208F8E4D